MNRKYQSVREKFLSVSPKDIKIASLVKGELLLCAFKSQNDLLIAATALAEVLKR